MQLPPLPPSNGPLSPVGRLFVTSYMFAQVGAYIAFIPLLTLLLPLKAESIDPVGRAELLGQVAFWGALAAGVAGILAGAVGDRTRHWPGGRGLWMALGLAGTVASYGLIYVADDLMGLMIAIITLQVSLNFLLNPLATVLPEHVPGPQRGMVSGFVGLAFPLSSLFGAIAIGAWLTLEAERLTAIVLVSIAMTLPFIIQVSRAQPSRARMRHSKVTFSIAMDRDLLIAFASRLLVQTAIALNVLYLLFYLDQESDVARALPGVRIEVVAGVMLATSTALAVVAGLIGGYVSDRIGRRRVLVCIGALLLAGGALLMALMPQWPVPLIAQAFLGLGIGLYSITDAVLVAEALPNPADVGRDLGLLNVAATAAQMLAPLLGLLAVSRIGEDLQAVYLAGAVLALIGGMSILAVRRVR